MNGSPAICSEKRVQRAQLTQRSRSSSTCGEIVIGLAKVRFVSSKRVSPWPLLIAWFCSGHSPPLSQTGQSSGWLISSSSITPLLCLVGDAEVSCVLTTMPSLTVVVHDASGFALALDLDQALPAGADRVEQRVVAEARDRDAELLGGPDDQLALRAITSMPSTVSFTWPGGPRARLPPCAGTLSWRSWRQNAPVRAGAQTVVRGRVEGAAAVAEMREVLVAEVLDGGRRSVPTAPSPSAQNARPLMLSQMSSSFSSSASSPWPRFEPLVAPGRASTSPRGTACTCRRTRARRTRSTAAAARTTQVVSSKTCSARVPRIDPAAATFSKSSGTSRCSSVNSGVEEPPGVQNFSRCPCRIPPASSSSSRERDPERRLVLPGPGRRARRARRTRSPGTSRCRRC